MKNEVDQSVKNKYIKAIYYYEEKIKKFYNNSKSFFSHKGYLIKYKDYENLKEKIGFNKMDKINILKIKVDKASKNIKPYAIKLIEFKTSQYLINMILNDNKYILINQELWKELNDKENENEEYINYKITNNTISFILDNNQELRFDCSGNNKNIIDKTTYKPTIDSNFKDIQTIYNDILNYYKFEKQFLNNIKNPKNNNEPKLKGFLVTQEWLDKWKLYSNYEDIKNNYLNKDKINKNEIIYKIIKNVQESEKLNKLKYKNLIPIKIREIKKEENLRAFLEKDSLVLINSNSFTNNWIRYQIIYGIYDNKIYLYLDKVLFIESNNNIISKNSNIKLLNDYSDFIHLKQLIKIFYFQKELNEKINTPYNPSLKAQFSKNNYIINKKIINNYKDFFDYKKLYNKLIKSEEIKEIKYDNFEKYFSVIIDELDKEYINELEKKKII